MASHGYSGVLRGVSSEWGYHRAMPRRTRARRSRLRALAFAALGLLSTARARAEPARSEYRLYAGVRHQGELMTANTLTVGRLALHGVDELSESIPFGPDDRAVPRPIASVERVGIFVFVDLPIISYTLVVPHELFGHAARHREYDGRPEAHFDLPLPYSLRADHYVTQRQTRREYGGEASVTTLGGLQAQEAYLRMLTATTFRTNVLRRGEALLYTSTSLTHVAQTVFGGDLRTASNLVAPLYRGDPVAYRSLTRTALVFDLIDPMLLYSLYASARYLVRGDRTTEPSLRRGDARFLATSRTLPVPWGVEHQLHILAAWSWASFDLGVRTGFGARESFGAELTTFDWRFLRVMRAGAELAMWFQPLVSSVATLGQPTPFLTVTPAVVGAPRTDVRDRTTTGAAARILFELDQPRWFLGTRLGYKSVGLWGERELAAAFEVALTGGVKLE